jgi:hypothetical protein
MVSFVGYLTALKTVISHRRIMVLFQSGAPATSHKIMEIIMLAFGIFSIGLALGIACGRKQIDPSSTKGASACQTIGLNGILVANH